jgi:hypothetical protein
MNSSIRQQRRGSSPPRVAIPIVPVVTEPTIAFVAKRSPGACDRAIESSP